MYESTMVPQKMLIIDLSEFCKNMKKRRLWLVFRVRSPRALVQKHNTPISALRISYSFSILIKLFLELSRYLLPHLKNVTAGKDWIRMSLDSSLQLHHNPQSFRFLQFLSRVWDICLKDIDVTPFSIVLY